MDGVGTEGYGGVRMGSDGVGWGRVTIVEDCGGCGRCSRWAVWQYGGTGGSREGWGWSEGKGRAGIGYVLG